MVDRHLSDLKNASLLKVILFLLYIPGDPYTSHADVAEGCSPPTIVNSLTVTAEIHPLTPNALDGSALNTAHGEWLST